MQGADYKFANDRDYRGIKRDFSFNADVVKDAVQTLSFPDGTENQRDLEVLLRDVDARCESIRQPEDSANSENSQTTEPSIAEIEITERASAIVNMESADGVQQIQSAISYCHYLMSQSPESSDQVPSSILVGRHSGVILQLKLKELVWSFPALFPDGRGGPDEQNRHYKYSFKALIDHYLSLAAHKFRNDNSFVLFAYDRLATNAAINGISLTCANNPELAENAASLRPDVLKSYFDWQLLSREARINFSEPPPLPVDLIPVQNILTTVKTRGTAKIPGSNAEREINRLRLDALTLARGTADFFFTLTPLDTGSMLLAFYAGVLLNQVSNINNATPHDMPPSKVMFSTVLNNPVLTAEVFLLVVESFISTILGFNWGEEKASRKGGLNGFTSNIAYFVESQEGGTLHIHGLGWTVGAPKSEEEWLKLSTNDEWRQRYGKFLESVVSTNYPIYDIPAYKPQCINTQCVPGSIYPIDLGPKLRYERRRDIDEPHIVYCRCCNQKYNSKQLLQNSIRLASADVPLDLRYLIESDYVKKMSSMIAPFHSNVLVSSIQQSILLQHVQEHWSFHASSCFKKGKTCRYHFPRKHRPESGWETTTGNDEEGSFKYSTPTGCNYLNNFVQTWFLCLPINHDWRFLQLGDGPDAQFYAGKYCSKPQRSLENKALATTFIKYDTHFHNRDNSLSEYKLGSRALMSLVVAESSTMEIAATMASLFIKTGTSAHFSCSFAPFLINQGLDFVNNITTKLRISHDKETPSFFLENAYTDYLLRPDELKNVSWYIFVACFEKTKKRKENDNTLEVCSIYFL